MGGGKLWSVLHKPFESFAGALTPFRSPGNHGNEDQERTLSCWRPEPGFEGGNEQREKVEEEKEGATAKRTPQFYKPYGGRQNAGVGMLRRISKVHSPFWSPTHVCSEPEPSPRRLGLCMLRTQTP